MVILSLHAAGIAYVDRGSAGSPRPPTVIVRSHGRTGGSAKVGTVPDMHLPPGCSGRVRQTGTPMASTCRWAHQETKRRFPLRRELGLQSRPEPPPKRCLPSKLDSRASISPVDAIRSTIPRYILAIGTIGTDFHAHQSARAGPVFASRHVAPYPIRGLPRGIAAIEAFGDRPGSGCGAGRRDGAACAPRRHPRLAMRSSRNPVTGCGTDLSA